ncbi:MAG: cell division protein SepF [Firmicutes bacterium]|nr:cell division protein SepF [Bacillota bacterium]
MPGFLDKILDLMGIEDEEYEEEPAFARAEESANRAIKVRKVPRPTKGRLISFPTGKNEEDGVSKVVLCELTDYDQIPEVVAHLRSAFPVVVNLRRSNPQTAQRFLDLLCGVIFALDGKIAKVEEAIYLLTPKGVDISADLDLFSLDPQLDWLNR